MCDTEIAVTVLHAQLAAILNVKMNVLHLQTIEMLHRFVIEISLVTMTCSIAV